MKKLYAIALSVSMMLIWNLGCFATSRLVPINYSTIQSAINAASNGDTVLVEPGTYYENLNFNGKNIIVCSSFTTTGNPGFITATIIDGNNNGISAVTFDHSETNAAILSGFTIQHANTQFTGSPNDHGGGIKILDASPVVEHCIIRNNYAFSGGGIYLSGQNSYAIIRDCTIESNESIGGGGGVRMSDLTAGALVLNSIIRNNVLTGPHDFNQGGAGVQIYHAGKLVNCLVINNDAPLAVGGGIYCDWGTYFGSPNVLVTGCTIANNTAMENGGVDFIIDGGEFRNCILFDNSNGNWNGNYFSNCCTTPLPSGSGNISQPPGFINSLNKDYHLNEDSPCIDAGNNAYNNQPFDLDGNARIINSSIDIGCYESPASNPNIFLITSLTPQKNALDIPSNSIIQVLFNQAIDTSTASMMRIFGKESGIHSYSYLFNPDYSSVTLFLLNKFRNGEVVEVIIPKEVRSASGTLLTNAMVWHFNVRVPVNYYSNLSLVQTIANSNPIGMTACDLDNDSLIDFFRTVHSADFLSTFKNENGNSFQQQSTFTGNGLAWGTYPAAAIDIDNDDDLDILAPSRFENLVSIWKNSGNHNFVSDGTLSTDLEPQYINVADFNGDGFQDFSVVCNNQFIQAYNIFLNTGTGSFTQIQSLDVTGDGRIDAARTAADIDNDGDIDLLADIQGKLGILRNTGNGIFLYEKHFTVPARYAILGDLNGDGLNDLIANDYLNGNSDIKCFGNNGNGSFVYLNTISLGDGAGTIMNLKDIDADGDLDLIAQFTALHKIRYYKNNGSANFNLDYELPGTLTDSWEMISSDIDNDGDLDLAISGNSSTFIYKSGPNEVSWTGNLSSDWFNAGNWNPPIIPGTTEEARIGIVSNQNYPHIDGSNAETAKLSIDAGANLHIGPTGNMEVNYQTICNGNIVIESNNTGRCGSILDNGFTGSGNFTLIRNIKSFDNTIINCADSIQTNNPGGWHYLSSPVLGLTTFTLPIGDYWVNDWSEADNSWYNFAPGSNIPCIPGADHEWARMKGYSIKYCPAYNCPQYGTGETVEFSGPVTDVNSGEISIDFTASDNAVNDFSNWNLLGNPYPSAIDPSTVFFPISADGSIYFWDDVNLTYQAWAGGVGPNIPPAQGFFFHALRSGVLTLSNLNRSFTGNQVFYKSGIDHLLTLEVSGNNYTDRSSIRFLDESTTAFDRLWDAYKILTIIPGVPQVYTRSDLENLAINTQPSQDVVPVYFQAGSSGSYEIRKSLSNDFSQVILEDLVSGQETDLLNSAYTFNYTAGSNPLRFKVHFSALSVPDYFEQVTRITTLENCIRIILPSGTNADVKVFDLLGRTVLSGTAYSVINNFAVPSNNTFYIVKLTYGQQVITRKVFVM